MPVDISKTYYRVVQLNSAGNRVESAALSISDADTAYDKCQDLIKRFPTRIYQVEMITPLLKVKKKEIPVEIEYIHMGGFKSE